MTRKALRSFLAIVRACLGASGSVVMAALLMVGCQPPNSEQLPENKAVPQGGSRIPSIRNQYQQFDHRLVRIEYYMQDYPGVTRTDIACVIDANRSGVRVLVWLDTADDPKGTKEVFIRAKQIRTISGLDNYFAGVPEEWLPDWPCKSTRT